MIYFFARIGAALGMAVEDVYTQNRRLWVRLYEKAASGTRCRATITLMSISPPFSTVPACATIPRGRCSAQSDAAPDGVTR